MKWLRLILLLSLALIFTLIPSVVLADDSEEVTVTVTGYVVGIPGEFTVTYVNDYEVQLSWEKPEDAEKTMVRAAIGRMPESRTDGYLLYYGEGESCIDTATNLDEVATPVYYRAWSQRADGAWEEQGAGGSVWGYGVTLVAQAIFILGLSGLALWRRHIILYLGAFVCLLLFGLNLLQTSWMWGLGPMFLAGYMLYLSIAYWFIKV